MRSSGPGAGFELHQVNRHRRGRHQATLGAGIPSPHRRILTLPNTCATAMARPSYPVQGLGLSAFEEYRRYAAQYFGSTASHALQA